MVVSDLLEMDADGAETLREIIETGIWHDYFIIKIYVWIGLLLFFLIYMHIYQKQILQYHIYLLYSYEQFITFISSYILSITHKC